MISSDHYPTPRYDGRLPTGVETREIPQELWSPASRIPCDPSRLRARRTDKRRADGDAQFAVVTLSKIVSKQQAPYLLPYGGVTDRGTSTGNALVYCFPVRRCSV